MYYVECCMCMCACFEFELNVHLWTVKLPDPALAQKGAVVKLFHAVGLGVAWWHPHATHRQASLPNIAPSHAHLV